MSERDRGGDRERAVREPVHRQQNASADGSTSQGPPDLFEMFGTVLDRFRPAGRSERQRRPTQADGRRERLEAPRRPEFAAPVTPASEGRVRADGVRPPLAEPEKSSNETDRASGGVAARPLASSAVPRGRDARSRSARLRTQLHDAQRVRDLILANELLSPPLSRRRRRRPGA